MDKVQRQDRILALRKWRDETLEEWRGQPFPDPVEEAYVANMAELQQLEREDRDEYLLTLPTEAGSDPGSGGDRGHSRGARGDDDRPFIRLSDGRPAAVERGRSWSDHPVVREQARRVQTAEQAVVGMHGSLGNLIRSMSTSSGSAVVPTVWATDIIDRARHLAAVTRAGAQTVPMDAKTVQIGRLTTDPTAAFRAEGSTVTASDPVFDNVTLDAKTMSALVVGSMEWFQDAPNVDEVVSQAIAKAIALQLDLVALFGGVTTGGEQTATGNDMLPSGGLPNPPNPKGILATLLASAASSVLGGAANGTVQTAATFYGEVVDTIYTPRDFNEQPNALLWPSHLARIYARAADTTNQPMRPPADVEQITRLVTNEGVRDAPCARTLTGTRP
jgi:HK97 family phage major capsid protein